MRQDYLYRCLQLHPKLTKIRYGREQDLTEIESSVAHVTSTHRLTYQEIERIRDSDKWNIAGDFGYWPAREECERALDARPWDLGPTAYARQDAIERLYTLFRQIEPVSVILRFVAPAHYGILSPPVENLLGLASFRSHTQSYLHYLGDLDRIGRDREFERVADVDMALWVLVVGVQDKRLENRIPHAEFDDLGRRFRRDAGLQQIRVKNLTRQLFVELTRPELAEALLTTDVRLAAQIAGVEFESSVRRLVPADSSLRLAELTRIARSKGYKVADWNDAIAIRNKAMHPSKIRKKEVLRLIEAMKKVGRLPGTC